MIQFTINRVVVVSILLRIGFFLFGLYQDAFLAIKYTDIDYLVFSDAANYVYIGQSPYERETYRYTPLLAWILVPNSWGGSWYHFGKIVFMICDLVTGFFIIKILNQIRIGGNKLSEKKVVILSSIWLLNPMVITISTRGSSESLLTVMVMAFVYYFTIKKNMVFSAMILGLSIHFKLYPIIYLPSALLYLSSLGNPIINIPIVKWINLKNIQFLTITLLILATSTGAMYYIYGYEFLYSAYLYHLDRWDHRHNFSIYNMALYYRSALDNVDFPIEKYAFIPQFIISGLLLPLMFARENFVGCLFIQTFAFVTFNKVITSQYFIWFLIFLPIFLSTSNMITKKKLRGFIDLGLWILSQVFWLNSAYNLEFLGQNTFDNHLLYSSIAFYLLNCWILKDFIQDLHETA